MRLDWGNLSLEIICYYLILNEASAVTVLMNKILFYKNLEFQVGGNKEYSFLNKISIPLITILFSHTIVNNALYI